MQDSWSYCLSRLQDELHSQQFNTWIRPLALVNDSCHERLLVISAPNRFIADWVNNKYLSRLHELLREACDGRSVDVTVQVNPTGARARFETTAVPLATSSMAATASAVENTVRESQAAQPSSAAATTTAVINRTAPQVEGNIKHQSNINPNYTFDNFVEGKSNQLAHAAALSVADSPGGANNPLLIYGGVGLGKTHLMHAVGNALLAKNPQARVVYLHSERFVADMVKALQLKAMSEFKRFYRSVDALLIDDIQFFEGKAQSQEEFFHTYNTLLESGKQMILTCDRYPREIEGLEERLRSRFGWGLTAAIDPPELETRVAILMKKADEVGTHLPSDVAFFIAQRIRSHVRDLEGALKRVIAQAKFTDKPVSIELVKESLKDLLALQDKLISITNIQSTVAEYYKIKTGDMMAKRRNRSVARPRQMAMALAKELTNHSLPEIGDAFGGRDHTTVLHACRKIRELLDSSADMREDYKKLVRALTT